MPQADSPSSTTPDRLEVIGRTLAALDAQVSLLDDQITDDATPGRRAVLQRDIFELCDVMRALRVEAEWLTPSTSAGCLALAGQLAAALDEIRTGDVVDRRAGERRIERLVVHLIAGLATVSGLPPRDLNADPEVGPSRARLEAMLAEARRDAGERPTGANVVPFRAA